MLAAAKSEPRPIVDERAENKANSRDLAGQSTLRAVAEGRERVPFRIHPTQWESGDFKRGVSGADCG